MLNTAYLVVCMSVAISVSNGQTYLATKEQGLLERESLQNKCCLSTFLGSVSFST
jgi:hypothetical protein